jgi:predicted O-methyltransferase YrrM
LDFVFFDANHQKQPTLQYFNQCIAKANKNGIFVFDDIHWSEGMEQAWEIVKQHPKVTTSIDLYHMGILFFNPELKPATYRIKL